MKQNTTQAAIIEGTTVKIIGPKRQFIIVFIRALIFQEIYFGYIHSTGSPLETDPGAGLTLDIRPIGDVASHSSNNQITKGSKCLYKVHFEYILDLK